MHDAMSSLTAAVALAPPVLMGAMAALARRAPTPARLWRQFLELAAAALLCAAISLALRLRFPVDPGGAAGALPVPGLAASMAGAWLAVLVLFLGTVIGAFSSRYLRGESDQARYVAALSGVLAAVQVLLLADHWLVLIAAWAVAGALLQDLLCFYRDRPFALLAAHKKRLADRLADLLLVAAAATAWWQVGSGSLAALRWHVAHSPMSVTLQVSAVCLVLAVILRTALLPVHGWLTQVMEAPTPVSALLHAGVVNLGGFVLLRFAPLLEAVAAARWLAVLVGLATAMLAGLVMLTRVSIKVRLAWSTVAQMGFMVLECGLGLYSLAMLHLIGHSLYKAHAFLSSSQAVRETTWRILRASAPTSPASLVAAPLVAAALIVATLHLGVRAPWPLWWSGVLACAWAPLLWMPAASVAGPPVRWSHRLAGPVMVAALTGAALLAHALPFGVVDAPDANAGVAALIGLGLLYLGVAILNWRPALLAAWRRRAYAGFYLDEFYTRAALALWPTRWSPAADTVVDRRADTAGLRAAP
jgi:NAD(P)H-quinone oxidoreductase subunit 5